MSWENKNVFITGIDGFVGSAVAKRLHEQGANIVGLVKSINNNSSEWFDSYNIYIGDISDYDLLREIISFNEIDIIYHFAAYSVVRVSARDPLTAYKVNVIGTTSLLEAARHVGRCSCIVISSSDKAYGDHINLPYREDYALQPKNTYDVSKACMDLIAQSYGTNYNMPIVVARCSNIYGPGDHNLSRLVPNTILRMLRGQNPMLYSDIENMEREFIFIDDVVDAYELLGSTDGEFTPVPGSVYNIGNNNPIKIRKMVETIASCAEDFMQKYREVLKIDLIEREPIFKEIEKQSVDFSKLNADFGWSPLVELEEGLMKTVEWIYEEYVK